MFKGGKLNALLDSVFYFLGLLSSVWIYWGSKDRTIYVACRDSHQQACSLCLPRLSCVAAFVTLSIYEQTAGQIVYNVLQFESRLLFCPLSEMELWW